MCRSQPQKVRLVVDLVRGQAANDALDVLRFMPKAAARPVAKVLRSAMANAEENFGLSRDDLMVFKVFADEGPSRRWRRFGARGRFKPMICAGRRTSRSCCARTSRRRPSRA